MTEHEDRPKLSAEQVRLLELLADGATDKEIAAEFYLCTASVKSRLRALAKLLGSRNRTNLVVRAIRLGLLPTETKQATEDSPEFQVGVTVFTSVRAVDHRDAVNIAEAAVARAVLHGSVPPVTIEAPHPRLGPLEVTVDAVIETATATRNGYLNTAVTAKAYGG